MKTKVRLNNSQITVISFIAQYRFVHVKHIQHKFNLTSRTSINNKLEILIDAGYLGKRYDKNYRLRGRSAAYYITPKALRFLKNSETASYINDANLRASYRDKSASESTVDHHIFIVEVALLLEDQYPGIKLFTPRQLQKYEYMPKPFPDLYLALVSDETKRFFLYHYRANLPAFALRQQIKNLLEYANQGSYNVTGNAFPMILAACDSTVIERQVKRTFRQLVNHTGTYIEVLTSVKTHAEDRDAWCDIHDTEELVSLDTI